MIGKTFTRKAARTGMAVAAALVLTAGMGMTAHAEGGLDIHTDYPGMTAKAGDSLTVAIDMDNSGAACDADLSIRSLPEGWDGYIAGGSSRITKIHVPNGTDSATATLHLEVPADTADGNYEVEIQASGNNGSSDTLVLSLDVNQLEVTQGDFSSEYPEQEGAADTSFTFNATLINNSTAEQTYSLSANAPDGWQVAFKPNGESTQVASLTLDPAVSQGLSITVTPPNTVEAGEYTIPCSAISAEESLDMELSVKVTEKYEIDLTTPDGRLSFDTHAGKESDVTLSITNNSNVAVENVNLTASAPTDWSVSFDTPTIDVIEAGATVEAAAHVTPSSEAITGDYAVTITASSSAVSDSAEFRVAVETSVVWGFAAILIIVLLLLGIGHVFKKYGRR